jgi:hypothetical protein
MQPMSVASASANAQPVAMTLPATESHAMPAAAIAASSQPAAGGGPNSSGPRDSLNPVAVALAIAAGIEEDEEDELWLGM